MGNSGDWDPFQDDWGSDEDWTGKESKSDFDFTWDTHDDFSQTKLAKPSLLRRLQAMPVWARGLAAAAVSLAAIFVFVQAGGITKLQTMGVFREQVSPAAACLNSGQVMVELGLGLVNAAVMNKALENADRLKAQRSGNADVDEAMWSVAEATYLANRASKSLGSGISFGDLMAGDVLDRLQGPEITDATEALVGATSRWTEACESLTNTSVASLTDPLRSPPSDASTIPDPVNQEVPELELDIYSAPRDLQDFIGQVQGATLEVACIPATNSKSTDGGTAFVADVSFLTGTVSSDVVIVTNHHVVENCIDGGEILLSQGIEVADATIVAFDERNDLALLAARGLNSGLIFVSSEIEVGQWVMASGHPQDVGQTVTFGQVTGRDPIDDWIASDALVGPGNSGGPLVNSNGEAIGVVGATYVSVSGMSAAVPIDRLCDRLLTCR